MNPTLSSERHISFAVNKENNSNESNHTTLIMNDDDGFVVTDENSTPIINDRRSKINCWFFLQFTYIHFSVCCYL